MEIRFEKKAKKQFDSQSVAYKKKVEQAFRKILREVKNDKAVFKNPKIKSLKGALEGCFAYKINRKDRLVFQIERDKRIIKTLSCKGHYND